MSEGLHKSALEMLMLQTPPQDARSFFMGSLSIREVLQAREGTTVLLPLRGAMPMFWAADGLSEIERPAVWEGKKVELPLGTYHYTGEDGSPRLRSPSRRAKRQIIDKALTDALVVEDAELTLIDEIQGGGTVTHLVRGCLNYALAHDLKLPMHLIAAEDLYAADRKKTGGYQRMSSNQYEGLVTNIVKIPLIGCDRDVLLDRVVFEGEHHLTDEALNLFSVHRNVEAELLFRSLGSMVRDPSIAEDDAFLRKVFDPLTAGNIVTSNRVEPWLASILTPGK